MTTPEKVSRCTRLARWFAVLASASLILAGAACDASAGGNAVAPTIGQEPAARNPDSSTAANCETVALERLEEFFGALNSQDLHLLRSLFPEDASWDIRISPDVLLAAEGSVHTAPELRVLTFSDLETLSKRFQGLTLTFRGTPPSSTYRDLDGRDLGAVSPILWRGEGPAIASHGRKAVLGGGKAAVDCQSGLIKTVLLSPLEFVDGS